MVLTWFLIWFMVVLTWFLILLLVVLTWFFDMVYDGFDTVFDIDL